MKLFEKIKNCFYRKQMKVFEARRKEKFIAENNNIFAKPIVSEYPKYPDDKLTFGIFSPVLVVMREMQEQYTMFRVMSMKIMGVKVNTQLEDKVIVEILCCRPGILIGKSGSDYDILQTNLTNIFGKKTEIDILEMKEDDINDIDYERY